MPLRKTEFGEQEYYHFFNRGANRERIFAHPENYQYLIRLLKKQSRKNRICLVCYCLMPNHFHLLVFQETAIAVSTFMQGLFGAYTQAFNRQQNRTGTLFEGRFKHVLVDKQEYLIRLMCYIHLNPVKSLMIAKPEEWEFSDYNLWTMENLWEISDRFHAARIQRFRDQLGAPQPSEYKQLVAEYHAARLEDDQMKKYFFD